MSSAGQRWRAHVRGNGDFLFDDSSRVMRELAAGHGMHMASGNLPAIVELPLDRLGVRDAVGLPCAPDLVGIRKGRPGCYERFFELAGADPREAVVVDDAPRALHLAALGGAAAVLARPDGAGVPVAERPFDGIIDGTAALPEAIAALQQERSRTGTDPTLAGVVGPASRAHIIEAASDCCRRRVRQAGKHGARDKRPGPSLRGRAGVSFPPPLRGRDLRRNR